jgi:hypothetical protein
VPPARVDPAAITPAAPVGAVPRPRWVRDDRTSPADDPEAPDEELRYATGGTADEESGDPIAGASTMSDPIAGAAPATAPAATYGPPPSPGVPGAYVAPAIVPTAATTVNGRPSTAAAIAAASVADGSITSVPAAPRPNRWFSTPDPAVDPASTPGKAGLFSDLPFRSPGDVEAWVVAVGALIGVLSFVLPWSWSENGVMGGQFTGTWTGSWGLANPADLIPTGAALALLLLSVVPNRIPIAIRGVVLPLLFGGWFLGIGWSYATGSYGLGWGVDALGVAGLLLVIGGSVAAWRAAAHERSAGSPPSA